MCLHESFVRAGRKDRLAHDVVSSFGSWVPFGALGTGTKRTVLCCRQPQFGSPAIDIAPLGAVKVGSLNGTKAVKGRVPPLCPKPIVTLHVQSRTARAADD